MLCLRKSNLMKAGTYLRRYRGGYPFVFAGDSRGVVPNDATGQAPIKGETYIHFMAYATMKEGLNVMHLECVMLHFVYIDIDLGHVGQCDRTHQIVLR